MEIVIIVVLAVVGTVILVLQAKQTAKFRKFVVENKEILMSYNRGEAFSDKQIEAVTVTMEGNIAAFKQQYLQQLSTGEIPIPPQILDAVEVKLSNLTSELQHERAISQAYCIELAELKDKHTKVIEISKGIEMRLLQLQKDIAEQNAEQAAAKERLKSFVSVETKKELNEAEKALRADQKKEIESLAEIAAKEKEGLTGDVAERAVEPVVQSAEVGQSAGLSDAVIPMASKDLVESEPEATPTVEVSATVPTTRITVPATVTTPTQVLDEKEDKSPTQEWNPDPVIIEEAPQPAKEEPVAEEIATIAVVKEPEVAEVVVPVAEVVAPVAEKEAVTGHGEMISKDTFEELALKKSLGTKLTMGEFIAVERYKKAHNMA